MTNVYVDIEYEGKKPSIKTVREAVLKGFAADYTGTYTFVKVEWKKEYKEFHFVFEAEDADDFFYEVAYKWAENEGKPDDEEVIEKYNEWLYQVCRP